jgi:hypothetical protein
MNRTDVVRPMSLCVPTLRKQNLQCILRFKCLCTLRERTEVTQDIPFACMIYFPTLKMGGGEGAYLRNLDKLL